MRGQTGSYAVDVLTRAVLAEFPELDPARLRAAVERAQAKLAAARLDTDAARMVTQHLAWAEATEDATERAEVLRELSHNLEFDRGDADRALVVRLAAFGEAPAKSDVEPLLRLGRVTERWGELPLEHLTQLVDTTAAGSGHLLRDIAAAWHRTGNAYRAADVLERLLAVEPNDREANDQLELFYRSAAEWTALLELLQRRAVHVDDKERAELFREIAVIYERELGDDDAALEAYQEADRLVPDHPDVLDGIARLVRRVGGSDGEALTALERLGRLVTDKEQRALVAFRAADIAKQHDYDKAQSLFEAARRDDPDLVPAIDGLAILLRDRGRLSDVIELLVDAAGRPALAAERSRWLADAGDYCVATGDTERAKALYRDARAADPTNAKAGTALVELCWDSGSLVELAPILDELRENTADPARLRAYHLQRSKVAKELGDTATARDALTRAVSLDPHDPAARRELADMLFAAGEWVAARQLIEGLLDDHEGLFETDISVELHYRVARCAQELGDKEAASQHAGVALALDPGHREALVLRSALGVTDPGTQLADQLALANIAPPDEKGVRFAALGDRYAELGDRATAREMYREALQYRSSDHYLLTKFLGLVADEGDWSYSLDLVQRLIDTEKDPKVRGRYRNLAAMIARDELSQPERARTLFEQALEDDPQLFAAADELETMLGDDPAALVGFLTRRLQQVQQHEGRQGERLRLWDKLGDLCLVLGRLEDALAAGEVAITLSPEDHERRERLADLYLRADPKHDAAAIHQHQLVLRANKRRMESYEALRLLYKRAGEPERARAVDDALSIIGMHVVDDKIEALFERALTNQPSGARRALSNEDWLLLARIDVDLTLSALFALVAPAFAAERAAVRPPAALPPKLPDVPASIARVADQVAGVFGITAPPVLLERDQVAACSIAMRVRDGALVPVLVAGRPAVDSLIDDHELAFLLARQLADLRTERIARLHCQRVGELSQIIELAVGDATGGAAKALPALEREQVRALGAKLRERGILADRADRAARDWLAATERAADRIGFVVVGDLGTCVRMLERDQTADDTRVLELVWSSITEEVLAVRGRVEGWVTTPALVMEAGA
jgi:tetratricopeptide (TPR) repeat protein